MTPTAPKPDAKIAERDRRTARHLDAAAFELDAAAKAMPNSVHSAFSSGDAKSLAEIERKLTILRTAVTAELASWDGEEIRNRLGDLAEELAAHASARKPMPASELRRIATDLIDYTVHVDALAGGDPNR